jgi:hypothetical protein
MHLIIGHKNPEGIVLLFSLISASDKVASQHHAPATLPPDKKTGNHLYEAEFGPGADLDGCQKYHPPPPAAPYAGPPARSQSLHQLRYQAAHDKQIIIAFPQQQWLRERAPVLQVHCLSY